MAVLGTHICDKCYNEFEGVAPTGGRVLCHECIKIVAEDEIKSVMSKAGCNRKMAKYLIRMQKDNNPFVC